MNIIADNA